MAKGILTIHHGRIDASPEEANYDLSVLARLNDHYAATIAGGTIQSASYLVSLQGKIIAHTSMGKLTYHENSPELLPDSIRKTYSITKFVTAAAIMQLVDRGLIYLNQSVASILPEFDTQMHRGISLYHLLTHTSGLRPDPGFYFEPYGLPWFEGWYKEGLKQYPELTWLQVVLAGPLACEPGKEHHYSTASYSVLGEIIAKVTGKSYEDYIHEEIFTPLGMSRSFFYVPERFRSEVCYTSDWEEKNLGMAGPVPGEPPKAGNGMYSSLRDLWRFGQMMLEGGTLEGVTILSPSAVRLMTSNRLSGVRMQGWGDDEADFSFGLGVSLDDFDLCSPGTYSHEGYGRSALYIDPVEQLVFVYFAPSKQDFSAESVIMPKAIVWSGLRSPSPSMPSAGQSGYRPEAIRRLEDHFQGLIDKKRLQAASYLMAQDGRIVASGAFGKLVYKEEDRKPLETDSIRRIASVTKLFTATAIFQLIEQGKVHLKQPVSDWIEEFKNPYHQKIQIWHLLTHTSGLRPDPGYFSEPIPFGLWEVQFAFEPEEEGQQPGKDEAELEKLRRTAWIRALLAGRTFGEPGQSWNYSSAGYMVLGEIIARASGMSYEDFVMTRIVKPLGMRRTFFHVPPELHAEVCLTNEWDEQGLQPKTRKNAPPRAGGGLYSTLEDLLRFGQMLLQGGTYEGVRILSRKSIERMSRNHLANRKVPAFHWGGRLASMSYGMGPSVSTGNEWLSPGAFAHEGAGRCKLLIDPALRSVGIFFVPTNVDWVPESMESTLNMMWSGWA